MKITPRKQGLLPIAAYTSQEWFQWEQSVLFGNIWTFAGMDNDLGNPGDYTTVQVGNHPIFIIRGQDFRLRAYHNLCRHRGTQLLRTRGNSKKQIVCPYHNWRYGIDGDLKHIPEEKTQYAHANIDKSKLCLHTASVETWREMIFVHPDPNPQPFLKWLGDVPAHTGPHQPDKLVEYEGSQFRYEVKANWKILIENFIDGYHLSHLHGNTLNMYDHKHQTWSFAGLHWTFFEPLADHYLKNLETAVPYPLIDNIPNDKIGAYLQILFPSVGITETESSWSTLQFIPVAPDFTILEVRARTKPVSAMKYASQEWKSSGYWTNRMKSLGKNEHYQDESDPMLSGDFMLEDIYACEQQQKSMHAPRYSCGPTATDEASIIELHKIILQYLPLEEWEARHR